MARLGALAPDRLSALRRVATIESIGSSTRIEGSKLSDRQGELLLSNLAIKKFDTRSAPLSCVGVPLVAPTFDHGLRPRGCSASALWRSAPVKEPASALS